MDNLLSIIEYIKRIKSISEIGLLYAQSPYDKERYEELNSIALEMMSLAINQSLEYVQTYTIQEKDYPTAKVDIRSFVMNDKDEILLVQEKSDKKWSLPGGWGDIGYSPSEIAIKETKEETGLDVSAKKLLAVFDKRLHPHPFQPWYVYKIIIQCTANNPNQILQNAFDTLDTKWFPINKLPSLSEDRILKSQIEKAYQIVTSDSNAIID